MKLIFIRHGEPDYSIDSLTEKGWREANILADRIAKLDVKQFYCSPLGRAQDTSKPTLKKLNRTAITLEWAREFWARIKDPITGNDRNPWDLMPSYWTKQDILYDKDNWCEAPIMKAGDVSEAYEQVCNGIDELLAQYSYYRKDRYYEAKPGNDDTIVIFCHLGIQLVILSHLLGIAAPLLLQGIFIAPTALTILETEEREEGIAYFRCKAIGDTSHLYAAGEELSNMGFFPREQMKDK